MKKTINATVVLFLLLTASVFAQSMCIELCTPCQNKKDQTCKKVESHCHCAALLDSLNQVQSARKAAIEESQSKLSQELQQTCDEQICTRAISFENGLFKELNKAKATISAETAQSVYDSKKNETQASMTRIEPLPPMNGECSAFCGDCPVTEKMLKSKKPKFRDKFCKKIEESCKCIDYAINARQLEEQVKADSIAEFEGKIKRIENAALLSKMLHSQCDMNEPCALTVTIANKEMLALDIQKTKEEIKENSQEPIVSTEERTVEEQSSPSQEIDSTTKVVDTQPTFHEMPQTQGVFHEVDPSFANKDVKTNKTKTSYLGISLAFADFKSSDFYGKYLRLYDWFFEFEVNLGLFNRIYFNRFVSFNYGINAVYHQGWYESFYLDFSSIMAEIPLGFRFGIPLGNTPVSIFFSSNFHIRKPIYQWIYVEYDTYYIDRYYSNFYKEDHDDVSSIADWEFAHLLGLGLEISRHFSIEFQWYAGNFRTYDGGVEQAYLNGDSWRIKIDIAF